MARQLPPVNSSRMDAIHRPSRAMHTSGYRAWRFAEPQGIRHTAHGPCLPVGTKELRGMLRPLGAVAATHGSRRTILVTAPAQTLGMLGMTRKFLAHDGRYIGPPDGNSVFDTPQTMCGRSPHMRQPTLGFRSRRARTACRPSPGSLPRSRRAAPRAAAEETRCRRTGRRVRSAPLS